MVWMMGRCLTALCQKMGIWIRYDGKEPNKLGKMITHLSAVGDHVCQLIEIFAVIFNPNLHHLRKCSGG